MRLQQLDVRVFEAAEQISPIGAGILVPPNAMVILERYGLAEKVRDAGVHIDSLAILDSKGRKISETPACFSKDARRYQTIAIHRGILQRILLDSLPSGIVLAGKQYCHAKTSSDGVDVFFEDGSSDYGGFLVGADGLHSSVRESIFPSSKLRYSGQVCWRGVSDFALPQKWKTKLSEFWGAGIRLGFVPIDNSRVYWYATKRGKAGAASKEPSVKKMLLDTYRAFPDPIPELISQTEHSLILRDDLYDLSPMESWFSESTVLIGDAAHAATPNLGQGGAQAIEDSWVLSERIAACDSLQDAFKQFQAIRFSKVMRIVNISWQIGKVTNLTNKVSCKIRDTLFRSLPKFMAKQQSRFLYDVLY